MLSGSTLLMDNISDAEAVDGQENRFVFNGHPFAYLVEVDNESGDTIEIHHVTQETTKIGRKQSCDIILSNGTVSSNHCEIEYDSKELKAYITDLDSTNHTRLGQQMNITRNPNMRCKPNRSKELHSGVFVTLGDANFKFYYAGDFDEAKYRVQPHINTNENRNTAMNDDLVIFADDENNENVLQPSLEWKDELPENNINTEDGIQTEDLMAALDILLHQNLQHSRI